MRGELGERCDLTSPRPDLPRFEDHRKQAGVNNHLTVFLRKIFCNENWFLFQLSWLEVVFASSASSVRLQSLSYRAQSDLSLFISWWGSEDLGVGGGGKKSRGFQGERSGDQSSLTGYRKKGRLYKIVYQGEVSLKYYRVYGGDQLNLAVTQPKSFDRFRR